MNKNTFLLFLKAIILLSPIPFGCVGRIWHPLFYLVVLIFSFFGLTLTVTGNQATFLYEKKIRNCVYLISGFILFMLLPLPRVLLKFISPNTMAIIDMLKDSPPVFHSISVLPYETLAFGLRLLVMVFFFNVLLKIELEKTDIFSLIHVIILSAVLQVLFGFLKLVQGNRFFYLFFYEDQKPDPHLTGTLANPDHFSFYLEIALPLAVAVLLARFFFIGPRTTFPAKFASLLNEKKKAVLLSLPVLLIGCGIILTGSGPGLVVLLLCFFLLGALTFYFSTSHPVRHKIKIIFTIILMIVILVGLQKSLGSFMRSNSSNLNSFTCWSDSVKLFAGFPLFGAGFGSFRYVFLLYDTEGSGWITHAHNDYLETFAEGGILGGILFLLPLGWIMVSLVQMWLARRNPTVKAIGLGILAACFSVGFHSVFTFALRIPAVSFLFVLIMCLGIKIVTYKMEPKHEG